MASRRLTKTIVEKLAVGETAWDGELRGFGARRRALMTSYVLKVRVAGR